MFGVSQDSDGVMWFSTRSGVVTFDGLEWKTRIAHLDQYQHQIAHLDHDRQGRVWMAGLRSPIQVGYWQDNQLQMLPTIDWQRKDHSTHSFTVHTTADGAIKVALAANSGHVWVWDGQCWHTFLPDPQRGLVTTLDWVEDRLLATTERGLYRADLEQDRLVPQPLPGLPPGPLLSLLNDELQDQLWLVGPSWIGRYQHGRFRMLAEDLPILLPTTQDGVVCTPDVGGGLFFADPTRVYHFSPATGELQPITRRSGLVGEGTRQLFRDREGNLWFCGQRGVSKLISRRFTRLDSQQGLLRDEVSAILMRRRGDVVLGHDGGLTFLGPPLRTLDLGENSQILGRVMDLEEDAEGNIWIAADRMGLARLDTGGRLEWMSLQPGADPSVFCVASHGEGNLWVGTAKGLFKRTGSTFTQVSLPRVQEGDNPFVRRLETTDDGALLVVAGVYGIFKIQDGVVQDMHGPHPVNSSFYAVLEKGAEELWVGTTQGLFRLVDGQMVRSEAPFPRLASSIYCMLETRAGEIWFGTENGALVWDGQRLRSMSAREGLLGTDTNRDALKQDAQGRVWIGTNRGLNIYDRRYDLPPPAPPLVQLRGLEVDGVPYPLDHPLELDGPPRMLVADFRLVTFVERRNLGIRARLEGFEDDWQPALPLYQRTIRYSNLPAGRYRLHLQAARGDSLIGQEVVSAAILIPRPFWQRWWFVLPAVVLGLLGLRLLVVLYSHRRYSRQLRDEVRERTRQLNESKDAIRTRSHRFQTTLDSVSDGVLTIDAGGNIILSNPAASKILGLEPEQIVDRPLEQVFPPGPLLVPGQPGETDFLNPLRGTIWLEALVTPLAPEMGPDSGHVLVLRDITTRRLHEAELTRTQKLESLGLLAGGLAHDFNNLLTIILGNIDLVEPMSELPPRVTHRLVKARRATVRARTLTEQLLTFARGGAPHRAPIHLGTIAEQTVSLVFTSQKHICRLEMAPDLWPVDADSSQMNQVISNLLINACQAMPDGGQVFVFGTNVSDPPDFLPPGQYVMLEVRDQGHGISQENLLKIFDPYFTTKETGSGLGLATAYSIVKRHGGVLKVASREGQGASFRMFLPRGDRPEVAEIPDGLKSIKPGQRILVMDDEKEVRHVIQAYLTRLGLDAIMTSDGDQALQVWRAARRAGRPHAAGIFDLVVPEGPGGKDLLAAMHEEDPAFPALVISGYSSDRVLADHAAFGFRAALPKPFDFDQFSQALGKVLDL